MSLFQRVAWTSAIVALLALSTTAFAPPVGRPPPGGRGGGAAGAGGAAGGRVGGNIGGANIGMQAGGRIGSNIGTNIGGNAGGRIGTNIGTNVGGAGGRIGGGTYIGRSPTQTHGEIKSTIRTNPSEAFTRLKSSDGHIIGESGKMALAREAVEAVAVRSESSKKSVAGLSEVRSARVAAAEMPAEIRTSLDRISLSAERRVLAEGLDAVRTKSGRWGEVTKEARERVVELNDARLDAHRNIESAEFRVRLVEAREALGKVQDLAGRAEAVAGFEKALTSLTGKKPAEEARLLRAVDRAGLPQKLQRQLDCLRGITELRELTARKWTQMPDVAEVKAVVARFERGLNAVDGADSNLGKHLLQDLAVKALLDGHPDAAMKLLPENGSAQHAANLLRDLKSLALGEGKVETWPAKAATPDPNQSPTAPRPPPGLEPLVPEGSRQGWRPPVKEKPGADLPPIEKAEKVAASLKADADKSAPTEKSAAETKANEAVKVLVILHDKVMAPELAERKKLAAVEAELDRRLKPAERVRVRTLLAQSKTARQIAEDLNAQPAAADDEEKEYLAEVERRLGRPLTAEQQTQAKRLRKQGRTSAEAADILRQ